MCGRKPTRPTTTEAVSQAHDAMRCHSTTLHVLHTHRLKHTLTYTPTHTQTHTGLLLSTALQLTASLGVVFLSSWLAEIKQDAISLNLLHIFLSLPPAKGASTCPGQSSRRRPWNVQPAPSACFPPPAPSPVVRTVSNRQPARFGRRAAPWSPAVCLELRCLLSASPATRKAVYGDTQCEKGADLKRRRMQARTTKVSYSKVYASPLLSSTP